MALLRLAVFRVAFGHLWVLLIIKALKEEDLNKLLAYFVGTLHSAYIARRRHPYIVYHSLIKITLFKFTGGLVVWFPRFMVTLDTLTHSQFQHYILYGFIVRGSQKWIFSQIWLTPWYLINHNFEHSLQFAPLVAQKFLSFGIIKYIKVRSKVITSVHWPLLS